jgi:hypothetical protein
MRGPLGFQCDRCHIESRIESATPEPSIEPLIIRRCPCTKALLFLGRGLRSKNDGAVYEWMLSGGLTQHRSPVPPTGSNGVRSSSVTFFSSGFKKLNVNQDRPDPCNYDNRDFLPQRHEPNLTPFSAFIGGRSLGCVANFSVSVMAVYINNQSHPLFCYGIRGLLPDCC